MILALLTVLIMLVVAGMLTIEGIFGACAMCFHILFAGLVAFNFFEPIASALDPHLSGTKALGYEDALCLIFLFWLTLGLLRVLTNLIANTEIAFHPIAQRVGGAAFGLVAGYLVSGFLVAAFQTLPLHENFLGYEPQVEETRGFRRYFPSDRVWLAMMRRAGAVAFDRTSETFDADSTFITRYARHRRYGDDREPLPYRGEFDRPKKSSSKK